MSTYIYPEMLIKVGYGQDKRPSGDGCRQNLRNVKTNQNAIFELYIEMCKKQQKASNKG